MGWIHSSQNGDKWRALVRPRVLFSVVILVLALEIRVVFQRTCFMEEGKKGFDGVRGDTIVCLFVSYLEKDILMPRSLRPCRCV